MSASTARFAAIQSANYYRVPPTLSFKNGDHSANGYGSAVFSEKVMQTVLPKAVFKSLKKTIETGAPLDASTADVVAAALRDWALERGATHYAHAFQRLTGIHPAKKRKVLQHP